MTDIRLGDALEAFQEIHNNKIVKALIRSFPGSQILEVKIGVVYEDDGFGRRRRKYSDEYSRNPSKLNSQAKHPVSQTIKRDV